MIKLRSKPQKPEGRRILNIVEIELLPPDERVYYDENDYDLVPAPHPTLAEVVEFFKERGIDFSQVKISSSDWDYCEYRRLYYSLKFKYEEQESELDYQNRLKEYKRELKEYQKWYQDNKEEIKTTKAALKAERDDEKRQQKATQKRERLERQRAKLEKELENI